MTESRDATPVEHVPVLAQAVMDHAVFGPEAVVVDATLGQGGHGRLLAERLGPAGRFVGLDVDPRAVAAAGGRLAGLPCAVHLHTGNFAGLRGYLREHGLDHVDFLLADLGYSSTQLADGTVGLSFQAPMPLDMRLDPGLCETAADLVNRSDERSLADLIYQYGQDRASRRIARFIVAARRREPITTTQQLAQIVARALYRPGKRRGHSLHPATRTFQALRIAVNHELENLEALLVQVPDLLAPGGRVAVISFHSLEDRLVKNDFRAQAALGRYKILTRKPLVADESEVGRNRRSRSAKLRIAERCDSRGAERMDVAGTD